MASLDTLLKQNYLTSDQQKVTLTVSMSLGALREQPDILKALDVQSITLGKGATARSTTPKKSAETRGAAKKSAKKTSQPASKTSSTAKKSKKKTPRLSQDAILAAIDAGHTTAPAIAAAINGKQRQISNALSRYLSAGLVKRVGIGEYAPTKKKK